jgi:hypothetical protein
VLSLLPNFRELLYFPPLALLSLTSTISLDLNMADTQLHRRTTTVPGSIQSVYPTYEPDPIKPSDNGHSAAVANLATSMYSALKRADKNGMMLSAEFRHRFYRDWGAEFVRLIRGWSSVDYVGTAVVADADVRHVIFDLASELLKDTVRAFLSLT